MQVLFSLLEIFHHPKSLYFYLFLNFRWSGVDCEEISCSSRLMITQLVSFQVVKNYNFVTMDQLEQDREIVEFCKKSLSYRKQLSGEEHEVR